MSISRESLEALLKEEEKNWRLDRVEDITIDDGVVAKGANFMSSVIGADLRAVTVSGKKRSSSVIIKLLQSEGFKSEFLKSHSLFATEIKVYTKILPLMEEVLMEQKIPTLWPRFLGQIGNALVFEDLRDRNYRVADRFKRLDMDHALISIHSLALFHSASVVLEQRGLLDVSGIPANYFFMDTPQIKKFDEMALRMAADVITHEWGPEWREIGERLHKKSFTIHDDILRLTAVNKNKLNVLCHGDLWTTNLMFKYSMDRPACVRMLDFQLAHYNSHVCDLVFFIQSGVRPELRRANTLRLLESYTETLRESLEFYGLGHLSPSLQDVQEEYERLQLASFLFAFTCMAITGSPAENALVLEALYEEGAEPFNPDIYRGTFKEDVSLELTQWAEAGLF